MVIPTPPTTAVPATTSAANMKTRSQGEAESTLMDDFIINRPRKLSAATTKKRASSHLSGGAKALNRAAAAPGQRRVSDFYYIDPNNVKNEDYLPELEMSDEPPVCIILSDSNENGGPMEVSSPASHTQVFEHPNLSPIGNKSDNDCFIIESSSSSSYYCTCR